MKNNKNVLITILFQSMLIILFNQMIFVSDNILILKEILPIMNLFILVLVILVVLSIKEIGNNEKKKIEANLLKSHLKQIEELYIVSQTQRHEYARHIQVIQAMMYLNELDEAKTYIKGISKEYYNPENIIYIGNPAITSLLMSRVQIAKVNNINFDYAIKCDVLYANIPPWDLCSIIGNILDNAFEVVIQNKYDKIVGLEIKIEQNKYNIYIYNNGPKISSHQQDLIFKEGYTTKNSKARGYGLYIVKNLVEQYFGEIKIISEKKTTFIVSFPL